MACVIVTSLKQLVGKLTVFNTYLPLLLSCWVPGCQLSRGCDSHMIRSTLYFSESINFVPVKNFKVMLVFGLCSVYRSVTCNYSHLMDLTFIRIRIIAG